MPSFAPMSAGNFAQVAPLRGAGVDGNSDRAKRAYVAWWAVFWTITAQARDWIVTPRVSLYQSYTSNAGLQPDGQDRSDFFTTLVPSIGIRGDTARLKLSLDYSLEAIAYAENSDLDQLRNNLNFISTLTLVPELL